MGIENPTLLDYQRELKAFGKAVEEARSAETDDREGTVGERARRTEALVRRALEWPNVIWDIWKSSVAVVTANDARDSESEWGRLCSVFESTVRVMRASLEMANASEEHGQPILGTDRLRAAIPEVLWMQKEAMKTWPLDPAVASQAADDFAAGRGRSLDEVFAAVAGVEVAEWQRRVEAHKAAREGR
jgi:hypothetical protein